MIVLAQLHAALDVVVDTEAAIRERSGSSGSPAIERLGQLMLEARELLRTILQRHPSVVR